MKQRQRSAGRRPATPAVRAYALIAAGLVQEAVQVVLAAVDVVGARHLVKQTVRVAAVVLDVQQHAKAIAAEHVKTHVRTDVPLPAPLPVPAAGAVAQEHASLDVFMLAILIVLRTVSGQDIDINYKERNTMTGNLVVAKAQAFVDFQNNKCNEEVYGAFMKNIEGEEISKYEVIHTFYTILLKQTQKIDFFDLLVEKYKDEKKVIKEFKISLLMQNRESLSNAEKEIKEYKKLFGETKEILTLELENCIMHNFEPTDKITEILNKFNSVNKEESAGADI